MTSKSNKRRYIFGSENQKNTPLILAVYKNDVITVRNLIDSGVNVDDKNLNGTTALMIAAGLTDPSTYREESGERSEYGIVRGEDARDDYGCYKKA